MSDFLIYGTFLLSICYAFFLAWIAYHWRVGRRNQSTISLSSNYPEVSIIIPARNEVETIGVCIESIRQQNYPSDKLEILVVDDHSTDGTAAVVSAINDSRIKLLFVGEKHGKKAALRQGIASANGELIITSDADVVASSDWVRSISTAYLQGAKMILGPVKMTGADCLLTAWQGLDVCGTMLLTGAAVQAGHPLLANGANLAFPRKHFYELGAYQGNEDRASGDDVFLLQKAVQTNPKRIAFVFNEAAAVITETETSWQKLFWQRLRWAGKTGGYRDWRLLVFQALVFALCIGLIVGVGLCVCWPEYVTWIGAAWAIKLLAEYRYLCYACREMGQSNWLKWLPLVQLTHPFYIALIGILALFPIDVRWKDRKTK